jgi:hypothetical protein
LKVKKYLMNQDSKHTDNSDVSSSGLDEAASRESNHQLTEWEKDVLLIRLETRLNNMRHGAYQIYGKYIMPLSLAFTVSGLLLIIAVNLVNAKNSFVFILQVVGNILFILGAISIVGILVLIGFDYFRRNYLDSVDNEMLSGFACRHFKTSTHDSITKSECVFFKRELDDNPLCLICPVYKTESANRKQTTS